MHFLKDLIEKYGLEAESQIIIKESEAGLILRPNATFSVEIYHYLIAYKSSIINYHKYQPSPISPENPIRIQKQIFIALYCIPILKKEWFSDGASTWVSIGACEQDDSNNC